jgi:putative membrane protein insertion efficiency factor
MAHQIIIVSLAPRFAPPEAGKPFPRFTILPFLSLRFSVSPFLRFFVYQSFQIKVLLLFLAILCFCITPVHAASLKGPWGWHKPQQAFRTHASQSSDPLRFMVELHRKYISPIDGKNCPMYPSCSRYSLQCLKKHGLFVGWVMTCDRLLRCGRDELRLSPEIVVNDELLCYDPLESNDFWWWNKK